MNKVERVEKLLNMDPYRKPPPDEFDKILPLFEPQPITAIIINNGQWTRHSRAHELTQNHRICSLADYPGIKILIDKQDIEQYRDQLFDPVKSHEKEEA